MGCCGWPRSDWTPSEAINPLKGSRREQLASRQTTDPLVPVKEANPNTTPRNT